MNAVSRAIRLEVFTVGWTAFAGAMGLIFGAIARSASLTAFGLDSVVELVCAVIVMQRLRGEAKGLAGVDLLERRASLIVGVLLLVAAAYVTVEAVWHLIEGIRPDASAVGMALPIATIPIMIPLAQAKLRLSPAIGSRALRADAIGNVVCWYLAAVVLVSLVVERYTRAFWIDGAASLLIVALLVIEGVKAARGDELNDR